MFVLDASDNFFQDVFQGDDPFEGSIFINNNRKVFAFGAESLQLVQ